MLNDNNKVKEFYNHPLIRSLSKPIKLNVKEEKKAAELESKEVLTLQEKRMLAKLRHRPAYIPSNNFASALIDIVIDAGTEKSIILRQVNDMRPIIDELKDEDREKANVIVEVIRTLGITAARSKAGVEFQNRVKKDLRKQAEELAKISTKLNPNTQPNPYNELKSCTDELITLIDSDQYDLGRIFESKLVLDQLRVGAQALIVENSKLSRSINSLLEGVEQYAEGTDNALALGRKNVEDWFDNTMDRLSGWYKRWAQVWAFFIGFAIALLFNVDSLYMAQQLWRNPATRLAATTYIQNYVEANAKNNVPEDTVLNVVQSDIQKLNFPLGWKLGAVITSQDNEKYAGENFLVAGQYSVTGNTGFITKVTELFPKGDSAKLLFFTATDMAGVCIKYLDEAGNVQPVCYEIKDAPRNLAGVLSKLAGCLITALAALQGAPFWFDTLKKLVNVRSTGINPIEKPKESASPAK
jgi:hypothetical protein